MKRAILFLVVFSVFISSPAWAFQSWGRTTYEYLDYRDFVREGTGYNITLVNRHQGGLAEFYVIVQGIDTLGNMIYRNRFFVEFIPGNGAVSYWIPGYNDRMWDVRILIRKLQEVDTLPRY